MNMLVDGATLAVAVVFGFLIGCWVGIMIAMITVNDAFDESYRGCNKGRQEQ